MDELHGSLEALAWGNTPPSGTGRQFDILYSKEVDFRLFLLFLCYN